MKYIHLLLATFLMFNSGSLVASVSDEVEPRFTVTKYIPSEKPQSGGWIEGPKIKGLVFGNATKVVVNRSHYESAFTNNVDILVEVSSYGYKIPYRGNVTLGEDESVFLRSADGSGFQVPIDKECVKGVDLTCKIKAFLGVDYIDSHRFAPVIGPEDGEGFTLEIKDPKIVQPGHYLVLLKEHKPEQIDLFIINGFKCDAWDANSSANPNTVYFDTSGLKVTRSRRGKAWNSISPALFRVDLVETEKTE